MDESENSILQTEATEVQTKPPPDRRASIHPGPSSMGAMSNMASIDYYSRGIHGSSAAISHPPAPAYGISYPVEGYMMPNMIPSFFGGLDNNQCACPCRLIHLSETE